MGSRASKLLLSICLLLTACGGGSKPAKPNTDNPEPPIENLPNILLIVMDDLGYNDLAINNDNSAIDTPNLDKFARSGMRFTRHYASAVCSPARVALLTGQYPERLGYLPNGRGISPEITTLPEKLQSLGYSTWHIGKWHIGDLHSESRPLQQGFDHWFGFLRQSLLAGQQKNGELVLARPRYEDPWLQGDAEPGKHYPGHLESILTDKAIEVLSELEQERPPWFLNLWFYAPHSPISPAEEYAELYPDTSEGRYRALVNQLDANIGRVLSHLEALDAVQNTVVVVVSDNGGTNREIDNNAPFYGSKASLYEGGLRTPLLIRWPDEELQGRVIGDTISIQDVYPTLLGMLGEEPPEDIDGNNFYPSLERLSATPRRSMFWQVGPSYSALSDSGRWKLHLSLNFPEINLFDLQQDPAGAQPVLPVPEQQLEISKASWESWYRDIHRVATRYEIDGSNMGSLTGMDMQRTPGFGPYTFGFVISDEHDGQLVNQQGIWNISRFGNTVMAQFGDLILSGDLSPESDCHSIVVRGVFNRSLSWWGGEDTIDLNLYLDGQLVDSLQTSGFLPVADLTREIQVGDPGLALLSGPIAAPVILSVAVDKSPVWTPQSFSQELCAGHFSAGVSFLHN